MTPDDIKKIAKELAPELKVIIDTSVNGKINTLTREFRDYVDKDMEWKKNYEPYIEGLANVSGGAKILIWIVVGITAVFTLVAKFTSTFK